MFFKKSWLAYYGVQNILFKKLQAGKSYIDNQ